MRVLGRESFGKCPRVLPLLPPGLSFLGPILDPPLAPSCKLPQLRLPSVRRVMWQPLRITRPAWSPIWGDCQIDACALGTRKGQPPLPPPHLCGVATTIGCRCFEILTRT